MNKKVLSEIALHYGEVKMPKDWDINKDQLIKDILLQKSFFDDFPFSKNWDLLNTYIRDYFNLKNNIQLINMKTWGDVYKPGEYSYPLLQADPVDLKNSADFVLLYGVKIKKDSCYVKIYYDDNRRKNRSWDMPLKENFFILFPATQQYFISANESNQLNFIQTITYRYELN